MTIGTARTIKVTIKGASQRAADIDGIALEMAGTGDTSSGTDRVAVGHHYVHWLVRGQPDDTYKVSLSGDTEDWSDDFTIDDHSIGRGFHEFDTK